MEDFTKKESIACSCDTCKSMCKHTPCIGTPEDIAKIVDAGFANKLAKTTWAMSFMYGIDNVPIELIAPKMTEKGCSFLDENNLCILHDLGLKPSEGRLSLGCGEKEVIDSVEKFKNMLTYQIVSTWKEK